MLLIKTIIIFYLLEKDKNRIKKGKEVRTPIPLVQKYSVEEIKDKLNKVKSYEFWISDTDDSQLLTMLGFFSNLRPHRDDKNIAMD